MWRLIVFFGCMVAGAFAEVFDISGFPAPGNHTLVSYYLFHVYAKAEGQTVNPHASVTFRNFEVKWDDRSAGKYNSLEVSLIPWSQFYRLVAKDSFCSVWKRLRLKKDAGAAAGSVPIYNVASQKEATFQLKATDAYLLTVTNCGDRTGGTMVKGEVIVQQPHGNLPANKIWTLQWLGWFALFNAFLCIIWAVAVFRHYNVLVYVQKVTAACALMAFLEAATSYLGHKDWNASGSRNYQYLAAAMIFYSLKYVLTLRMLLETASGSGITMQKLEVGVEVKMDVVCAVFLAMQFIWKAILSYRYRMMLNGPFLAAISIPGTLLWLVLFIWVYRKFRTLMSTLQEKKLASEAESLFINTRLLLLVAMLLAAVVLMLQLADMVVHATPWELQWVPYDAAPHSVYTLFLIAFMILWWPNADSWKLGYSEQVDAEENATGGDGKAQAEQIGAAEEEL